MNITLRPGERLFVNGAVLRVDRKVSIELMNDVQFLLQSHVMQAEDAKTPLRQLYFAVQMVLINPKTSDDARAVVRSMRQLLGVTFENAEILAGLRVADGLIDAERYYEALRTIRSLFAIETAILDGRDRSPSDQAA